jgi:hypothetical protein
MSHLEITVLLGSENLCSNEQVELPVIGYTVGDPHMIFRAHAEKMKLFGEAF